MKIFVPYTKIDPFTMYSLRKYSYQTKYLTNDNSYAYYFTQRWNEAEDFINVEHDVIFWEGAIEALIKCPENWCVYKRDEDFSIEETMIPTLCLTKFTTNFIKGVPVDWSQYFVDEEFWKNKTEKNWQCCDSWIWETAKNYNVFPHFHEPPIFNISSIHSTIKNLQLRQDYSVEHFHKAERLGKHPSIIFNQYLSIFQNQGLNFAESAYKALAHNWPFLVEGKTIEDFSSAGIVISLLNQLGV